MYENESRNLNENINPEGNMPGTAMNWTTPRPEDFRNQGSDGYGPSCRDSHQLGYNPTYSQQTVNRGGHHGNGSSSSRHGPKKETRVEQAAGITAAAVLFGMVSGGVMTDVSYLGARITGLYGTATAQVQTQAQIPQVTPAITTQDSGNVATVAAVTDASGIVENVMPSIVAISDTMTVQQRDFFGAPRTYQAQSSGSRIIVSQTDAELLIATSNHTVDDTQDLKVTFVDNDDVSAAVKGMDSAPNLAIIAVQLQDIPSDTTSKIKVASPRGSDNIKVGRQVVVIGNALGYSQPVTVGYIGTLDREITDSSGITKTFVQTDAAINPGNSGDALIDLNGNVIGAGAAKTASTKMGDMGFAVPISKAQEILDNLATKRTCIIVAESTQGYLGIQGTNIDASAAQEFGMPVGTYMYKIVEGGAAASSELKEKDIITKFGDQSVTDVEELKQMLTYYEGGSTATLTVQSLVNGVYMGRDVQVALSIRPVADSQNTATVQTGQEDEPP